jgi:hypothetical protein
LNLNFRLHGPFPLSYLPIQQKQEDKEEEGLSSVFTLLKVISLDCNHETKATLLSYLRAIKHRPKNASILFLSSTVIKSKYHQMCLSCPSIHHCFPSHRHQRQCKFSCTCISEGTSRLFASLVAPPTTSHLTFLRSRIDSRRDCCIGTAQIQP